jgi:hypothetical protein
VIAAADPAVPVDMRAGGQSTKLGPWPKSAVAVEGRPQTIGWKIRIHTRANIR